MNTNNNKPSKDTSLDNKSRVKVLSPSMLVMRRFVRSKLAIIGIILLAFMFLFAFLGSVIVPYKQDQVFRKNEIVLANFGEAKENPSYTAFSLKESKEYSRVIENQLNQVIFGFGNASVKEIIDATDSTSKYQLSKINGDAYILSKASYSEASVGTYYEKVGTFTITDPTLDVDAFKQLTKESAKDGVPFTFDGRNYIVVKTTNALYNIIRTQTSAYQDVAVASNLVFDSVNATNASDKFITTTLLNINKSSFIFEEVEYLLTVDDDSYLIETLKDGVKTLHYFVTSFVFRDYMGNDTIDYGVKILIKDVVDEMMSSVGLLTKTIKYDTVDESGNAMEIEFIVNRKNTFFEIKSNREMLLIDIYAKPSSAHWFGTDANGMDVLTRMMYGGKISLMIGFIVVFIEILLGVILGGLAGYFGGWVDEVIMRLVDVFYCIPFIPIMIILGSLFDNMQMDSMQRIVWMMIVMGVLGWAGIARLVRGQILSLREQEFMIAAEATGLSTSRRIFKHLIPNVMPQLIVNATMGLGGIILTESTLSFLGLGAKFPIATWGAMINSISNASDLTSYYNIWVPVGLLICLTVIAFNFVGDGLRDAFDPKMKR